MLVLSLPIFSHAKDSYNWSISPHQISREAIKKRDEAKGLHVCNINPITHCAEKKVEAKNTCTNTFKRIIQKSIKVKMAIQSHLYCV